jgi:hypothetical protein
MIEIRWLVNKDGTKVLQYSEYEMDEEGARKIPALMRRLGDKGIDIKDLGVRANNPIQFITPSGNIADGYDARMLPDLCAVLIEADRKRALDKRYTHLADRAARRGIPCHNCNESTDGSQNA